MSRKASESTSPERPLVHPSEAHMQLALRGASVLMAPVVRWLLRHGVSYGRFADLLKSVFVSVAREELERGGSKATVSALSVLSGVHRKDVRTLVESGAAASNRALDGTRHIPLASQVFTRWITDKAYRDRSGKPLALPRVGVRRSFESLCTGISTDVHPRTVLAELVRLGLAQVSADEHTIVPLAEAFVPSQKLDELTDLFATNVADHVAAAVHNLTLPGPKYLERSVWADGLSAESAAQLHQVSRDAWDRAFETVVAQARERVKSDAGGAQGHRIRFGVYFYGAASEDADPPPDPRREPPTDRRRRTAVLGVADGTENKRRKP